MGASQDLIQELITLCREDVPDRIAALGRGLEAGNLNQVMEEAHQLKGSLGNLGLLRFADLTVRIEDAARAARLEDVQELRAKLPKALQEALAALAEAFPAPC
jgi:HPt (histidine-containing phosphotransfer) domain-containing protein